MPECNKRKHQHGKLTGIHPRNVVVADGLGPGIVAEDRGNGGFFTHDPPGMPSDSNCPSEPLTLCNPLTST
eukprot:1189803-Prorocentrum_minimum.AAC.3